MAELEFRLPKFLETQQRFIRMIRSASTEGRTKSRNHIIVAGYFGGWGSGKTTIGKWVTFDYATCFPKIKILVVRETFASLNLTSKQEFLQRMTEGDPEGRNMAEVMKANWNEERQTYTHVSGATVTFGGLDKVDKWGSTEFGLIWIDEASLCKDGDIRFLLSRLRQVAPTCPDCSGSGCDECGQTGDLWGPDYQRALILTANHVYTEHFLYKRFVRGTEGEPPRPNHYYVETSSFENSPEQGGFLPEGYLETLAESEDEHTVSVFMGGSWGVVPKGVAVYAAFTPSIQGKPWHERPTTYDPSRELIPAIDFGYRFPFLTFHQLQARGRWRVLGEFTMPNTHTEQFCEGALEMAHRFFPNARIPFVYGDPAGRSQRSEGPCDAETVEKVFGCRFLSVPSTERSKKGRRQVVRKHLSRAIGAEPEFAIDSRRCPRLSEAFRGMYRYEDLRTSFTRTNYTEIPVEEHPFCDVMHSLEYFAANHYRRELRRFEQASEGRGLFQIGAPRIRARG